VPTAQQRFDEALAHHQAGRLAEAEQGYRNVLAEFANNAEATALLGLIALQTGHAGPGKRLLERAVELDPRNVMARQNLAVVLSREQQFEHAAQHFRAAAALQPSALIYTQLGKALHTTDPDAAIDAFRQALRIDPNFAAAHSNLGVVLTDRGQLSEADVHHRAAVELSPQVPLIHVNYGQSLFAGGDVAGAIAQYDQATALAPGDPGAASLKLLASNYQLELSPAAVYDAHCEWVRRYSDAFGTMPATYANDRNPDQPLRVGYVSGDFRRHAVAHFFEPLLAHHRRDVVHSICYSSNSVSDEYTARLRSLAGEWRDVVKLDDQQLAELIRADRIDILVDLSGHTGQNRLLAFARRPAPVQVQWLGYPGYTGVREIDDWIADPLCDPPDDPLSPYPPERVVRLPDTFACYLPPSEAPDVSPLPARKNGHVTFGSFNILAKLNDQVLDAWSAVMRGVPGSRMVLGDMPFADPGVCARIAERFESRGVARERLTFHGHMPMRDYLAAHAEIDLMLDTWPFTGHTLSLHALWMGCGLITLRGDRHVARRGAALLELLGLQEWIADTSSGFVGAAVRAASDLDRLDAIRSSLRQRMRESPLLAHAKFAEQMESACRSMWRKWCER
jgi:predicted O-linked N-acetylglucosamine transferase (SPINDLY family)